MMLHFNLDFLIALLLIKEVKGFRDSYSLTKVLAWKFDIIQFVELIDRLQNDGLIKIELIDGKERYEITDRGREYLKMYLVEAKPIILEKYSEEEEFITSLFNNI